MRYLVAQLRRPRNALANRNKGSKLADSFFCVLKIQRKKIITPKKSSVDVVRSN